MAAVKAYASNIISPYHRTGVLAFLRHFSSGNRPVEAHILIEQGSWDRHLLAREQVREQHFSADLVEGGTQFGIRDLLRAVHALLFSRDSDSPDYLLIGHSRVNVRLLASLFARGAVNGNMRLATVVIDEGIGTYAGYRYRYAAFCRENRPALATKLLFHLIYPVNQHLLKSRRLIDYDWRLLGSPRNGKFTRNETAISGYRDAFRQAGETRKTSWPGSDVLLITQPLVSLGLLQESEYREALERLHDFASAAGISVNVKCHPAEQQDDYRATGFSLIEDDIPVEALISTLEPGMVLGFSSTALINSRLIFGIRSYSMLDLLSCGEQLKAALFADSSIQALYRTYVDFLPDWIALEACVDRLAGTSRKTGNAP